MSDNLFAKLRCLFGSKVLEGDISTHERITIPIANNRTLIIQDGDTEGEPWVELITRLPAKRGERRFSLVREQDVSGVSGTGVVAEGVEFPNGQCVIHWLGKYSTIELHPNIDILLGVHGHNGLTTIQWED